MPTKLVIRKELDPDVERIIKVCAENDYEITAEVARLAWENYSDSLAASWMGLPQDDATLLETILFYTQPEEI